MQSQPKREVFNPLAALANASGSELDTSLSAMSNSDVGVCPKCKSPMGSALIANKDSVYYCLKDRVALPMPNNCGA